VRLVIDGQRLTSTRTGVGRCLELLLSSWAETGWPTDDVVLVLRDRGGLERVPRAPGLRSIVVGERWPGLVWENVGLGRILRRGDLLFAPANLVPWTWRGATVAVLYDTLPWSVPGCFPWHVRAWFGGRYRMAARRATRIVAPSDCTARDLVRVHGVPRERIEVVHPAPDRRLRPLDANAPEVRAARAALGLSDAPFFLFVGKRSPRRNVPAIVSAFARVQRRHGTLLIGNLIARNLEQN
jgi:glycosyltransferase involved in cell wall biosynthesis